MIPKSAKYNNPLSPKDVREIRKLFNHGSTLKFLAEKYGVTIGTIWNIKERRTRKDVK